MNVNNKLLKLPLSLAPSLHLYRVYISRIVKQFWVKKIIKLLGIIVYPAYVLKRLNQHFQVPMQVLSS